MVLYSLNTYVWKGNNSVKYAQKFMKSWSGHLHHVLKLYVWHHGPSSSSYPDILFTRALNCKASSLIQLKFELYWDFMPVLNASKFEEYMIENESLKGM